MSYFDRTAKDRAVDDLPWIGAMEITSFNGQAANDNGGLLAEGSSAYASRSVRSRRTADWTLPVAAFVSGLTAAFVVSGLSELLGLAG